MPATAATKVTYAAVLKEQYHPAMQSAVFTGTVLLDSIVKRGPGASRAGREGNLRVQTIRTGSRAFGKQLTWDLHVEPNWGIGARAAHHGPTTGFVPAAGSQGYVEGKLLVAHYYGHSELDGSLIDATQNVTAAGLRALDSEMKNLPPQIRRQINLDLYGDGTGRLANVTQTSVDATFTVDTVQYLEVNQPIVIAAADGTGAVARTITAINAATLTLTVDSSVSVDNTLDIFRAGIHNTSYSSEYGNALSGLGLIASETTTYAGLNRTLAENAKARSLLNLGLAQATFTIDPMESMVFDLRNRNAVPNLIVCDRNFYTQFGKLYFGYQQWQTQEKVLRGGYPALYFHEVPLVRDRDCPPWTAYFLDTEQLELGVEKELGLMNADGADLARCRGPNGELRDAYDLAHVTRLNLMALNPGGIGKMTITPT